MQLPSLERSGPVLATLDGRPVELIVDLPAAPDGSLRGIAVVAHPQPLMGGHARHKVPEMMARALLSRGLIVVRPNFRGVSRSGGAHDAGAGETDDLLALADALRARHPQQPLTLAGFSFGAFVQARVAAVLHALHRPADCVMLVGLPSGTMDTGRHYDTPDAFGPALLVHGEADAAVPLASVLQWARPQTRPVVVVPGADHFLTGRLPLLQTLMTRYLDAHAATGD